jgi:tryptophan-rich sensory protein
MIAATLRAFWRVKKSAGWLMVRYLAWVSFATVLNYTIWRLNA